MLKCMLTAMSVSAGLLLGGPAQAVQIIGGDENSPAFQNSGFTILKDGNGDTLLVGEGRAGDGAGAAEKEVVAGGDTGGPLESTNHDWNGDLSSFSFSYNASDGLSRMTIGNDSATFTNLDTAAITAGDLNALVLRIRLEEGESMALSELTLNGQALGAVSYTRNSGDPSAQLALFDGLGDLTGGFMLSGTLDFPQITSRQGSRIAFQIKGANAPEVPVPATLALLGMGLAGVGFARRRSARA